MEPSIVQCPYCFEFVEIFVEDDVFGSMVQDCEVCCQPWLLHVQKKGRKRVITAERS